MYIYVINNRKNETMKKYFLILMILISNYNSILAQPSTVKSTTEVLENPILYWGSYMGCNANDWTEGHAVARSQSGDIFYGGQSKGSCLGTSGSFRPYRKGETDGYLQRFNAKGERLWGTYYGGNYHDAIYDIVEDSEQNIIVLGATTSYDFISTPGAYQEEIMGNGDAFIVKFNAAGERLWATYYGGESDEAPFAIAVDKLNNIIISGLTFSSTNIATPNSHQEDYQGFEEGFIAKFTPQGDIVFATYLGGIQYDAIYDMTIDSSNNIYACGSTCNDYNIATPGTFQPEFYSQQLAFLVKFNPQGQQIWGSYFGGESIDDSFGVGVDEQQAPYIVGYTHSSTNIATLGAHKMNREGFWDAFIAKFTTDGLLNWATYFGGTFSDILTDIEPVPGGEMMVVSGNTTSNTQISSVGAHQEEWCEGYYPSSGNPMNDYLIAGFSCEGVFKWGTYMGSEGSDYQGNLAVDSENVYYIGTSHCFTSSDHLVTPNCFQEDVYTYRNAFLGRFSLVDTIVNISSVEKHDEIQISPNPCKNYCQIESQSPIKSVLIYNVYGQLIKETNVPIRKTYYMDLRNLVPANYILIIKTLNGESHAKLQKL